MNGERLRFGSGSKLKVKIKKVAELSEGYGRYLAMGRDGLWVSATSGLFHLWKGMKLQRSLRCRGSTHRVSFSADGKHLFVSPWIYDLEKEQLLDLPMPLSRSLNAEIPMFQPQESALGPEGKRLVLYARYRPSRGSKWSKEDLEGPERRLVLLDGRSRELVETLWQGRGSELRAITVGKRFIAAGGLEILVWDPRTRERVATLSGHSSLVRELRFSPEGSLLASVGSDRQVMVWDTATWSPIQAWQGHKKDVWAVAFHPTEPILATGGWDKKLVIWSLAGQKRTKLESVSHPGLVEGVAFSPSGDRLVVATRGTDSRLFVYDLEVIAGR